MAVKDIVAGAEMFLRTAGMADENMRRQLLQRIQQQALEKGQMEMQNTQMELQRNHGAQQFMTNYMDTSGRANQVGADYAPPGMSPEGMVGKPDMGGLVKGLMPYLTAQQAVTALTSISEQEYKESPQQRLIREMMVARAGNEGKTPNEIELRTRAGKGDKEAQMILDAMEASKIKIAKEGRAVFGTQATSTPGIWYKKDSGKYFMNNEDGTTRELSSKEVEDLTLKYKEMIPTNDIKVMQQSVPSVTQLIKQTRVALQKTSTGPLAGRWNKLWSTDIGADNPDFITLKDSLDLLQTRLMKMHVGARGGEYIMQHFQNMLDSGKLSAKNLESALNVIEEYSKEVGQSIVGQTPTPGPGQGATQSAPPISALKEGVDRTFKNGQTWTLKNGQAVRVK